MAINKIKIKPKNFPKSAKICGFEKLTKRLEIVRQGYKKPFDPIRGLIGPLFGHK